MMDIGVYSINGARYLLGEEPIWVTAQETKTDPIKFKEGVDDNSCSPGVNQIPLLEDQVKTLKDDVAELKNNVQALNDVSNNEYKTDINQDDLNANADPAPEEEEE